MYTATRNGPSTSVAGDGSRTLTITNDPTREENGDEQGDDPEGGQVIGSLHIRTTRQTGPRVAWDEDVIDNEGFGKKKSKSNSFFFPSLKNFSIEFSSNCISSLFQFAAFTINHGDSTSHHLRMDRLLTLMIRVLVHTMMTMTTTTIIVIVPLKVDLALRILGRHRGVVE
jgi:hypothetical protein